LLERVNKDIAQVTLSNAEEKAAPEYSSNMYWKVAQDSIPLEDLD